MDSSNCHEVMIFSTRAGLGDNKVDYNINICRLYILYYDPFIFPLYYLNKKNIYIFFAHEFAFMCMYMYGKVMKEVIRK